MSDPNERFECVYCDQPIEFGDDGTLGTHHWETCEKHPAHKKIADIKQTNGRLKGELKTARHEVGALQTKLDLCDKDSLDSADQIVTLQVQNTKLADEAVALKAENREALAVLRLLRDHRDGFDWEQPIPSDLLDREHMLIEGITEADIAETQPPTHGETNR